MDVKKLIELARFRHRLAIDRGLMQVGEPSLLADLADALEELGRENTALRHTLTARIES